MLIQWRKHLHVLKMSNNSSPSFIKDSSLCPDQEELEGLGNADPALIKVEIVFGSFLVVYAIIGLIWYRQRKKSSIYLRGRDTYFIYIATVAMLFGIWSIFTRDIVGRENFPCILIDLVVPILIFFAAVPMIIRTFIQINKVKFRLLLADKTFEELIHDPKFGSSLTLALAQPESKKTKDGTLKKGINRVVQASLSRVSSLASDRKISQLTSGGSLKGSSSFDSKSQTSNFSSTTGRKLAILPDHIARMQFYSGRKFGLIASLLPGTLLLLIFSAVYAVNDGFSCRGCESVFNKKGGLRYILFSIVLCMVFLLLYSIWKLKKEPDPKGMRKEMSTVIFFSRPMAISWLVLAILDPGDLEKDGKIQWFFFICLSFFTIYTLLIYRNIKKSYKFSLSNLAANGNSGISDSFDEVLQSEIGTKLFKAHLVNEVSIENFYFWKEASVWKASFNKVSRRQRKNRFMYLYDMFLNDEHLSPLLINLEDEMYTKVRKIVENGEELTANSLDGPINTMYVLLSFDSFPRFRDSPLYEQYLSEIDPVENDLEMSL